jgi:hypothetical protein
MTEYGPAVSRLCVAATGGAEPLRSIQESGDFYRLYLTTDPADGAELAVAAPGLDEVSLISDLIGALRERVADAAGTGQSVVAGFHVGIVKLTETGFSGTGVERALALIRDPVITTLITPRAAADPRRGQSALAVAITAGFFEGLRAEGLPGDGWRLVSPVGAWLRLFDGHQA